MECLRKCLSRLHHCYAQFRHLKRQSFSGIAGGIYGFIDIFADSAGYIDLAQMLPHILQRVDFGTVGASAMKTVFGRDLQCFYVMPYGLLRKHNGNSITCSI